MYSTCIRYGAWLLKSIDLLYNWCDRIDLEKLGVTQDEIGEIHKTQSKYIVANKFRFMYRILMMIRK